MDTRYNYSSIEGSMDTWYDIAMKHVVDQTWVYNCCSWDICSKRFYRFCVNKYREENGYVSNKARYKGLVDTGKG